MTTRLFDGGRVVTTTGFSSRPQKGNELGGLIDLNPGYVVVHDEEVRLVTGNRQEALAEAGKAPDVIDARGMLVIPGYVDCHTHLAFAGYRDHELTLRLTGAPYLEILAAGGGILSTVQSTRAASEDELVEATRDVLDVMLAHGTTTVEAKSGYGLTTEAELKQLRALGRAGQEHPVEVVRTFMGAHALPPEYADDRAGYVSLVMDEMIPLVAEQGVAEFCDCFCESKAFTIEESRRILERGKSLGLRPRVHADEITPLGGARLAAEVGAVSAEHLIYADEEGIRAMADAGVVAVLLPATAFILRVKDRAPFARMIELGVSVAIATDYNPGTSPLPNMQLLQAFACYHYGLTPAQAFAASTINAAHAVGRADRLGSLEPGKQADIVLLKAQSLEFIPYHLGVNLVHAVYKKGRQVYGAAAK